MTVLDRKSIGCQCSQICSVLVTFSDRRDTLFELSGIRGKYPQFFLIDERKQELTFLGDWEAIEGVNDATSLPREILNANPSIVTWEDVLG